VAATGTAAASAAATFPTGVGLGVYGSIGKNLNVFLQALQTTGKFNVISRPTIFMSNNQMGSIASGTQIAVPTSSYNGGTTGTSTNIAYRDVQLQLQVIPLVNSNDEVTLQISLVSQDLGTLRTIGSGTNAMDTNDIISRQILTTVTVPNNQTVVLGGLITSTDSNSVSGIPILSSIPYLGKLFSTTAKKKDRKELLFFLTPRIIHDARSLEAANRDMDRHYADSGSIRAFENGPGVLPPKGSAMDIPVNGEGPPPADEASSKNSTVHKISARPRPKSVFSKNQ
jgi:type II secretory pathway component GspD/PulD (secretin)